MRIVINNFFLWGSSTTYVLTEICLQWSKWLWALSLKKKHQDAIAEMSEQIDQLNKLKAKAETEKATIKMQTDDLKAAHDHLCNEKVIIILTRNQIIV